MNPRLGKVIKEVRVKGALGFKSPPDEWHSLPGELTKSNAIILAAISVVQKRAAPALPPAP
ncbi:MAG TPA: hypothetical protein PLP42_18205 [Acidobacteriota bacterium]|nr:hypothetical protein [Acidobacteriota bacterium]